MERDRKSERNQQIYDRKRLEKRQRRRVRSQLSAPRFVSHVVLPEVPEGMELHKFYGEPALLPAKTEGEVFVGRMPYTQRQLEALGILEDKRRNKMLKENTIRTFGIYVD